jgi:uncharacterized membrane protein
VGAPATSSALYAALMWAGGVLCHQMPERSPHLWGAQLPLCWRCTGIALGACALLAWLCARRRLPPLVPSLLLSLALPLDVLYSALAAGANSRRLLTGLLWGFFAAAAWLGLLARTYARRGRTRAGAAAHSAPGASAK